MPQGVHPLMAEPVSSLAPDPTSDPAAVSADYMQLQLKRYSAPIKSVLLAQDKVVCGVGNWVADEVLFRSGVHPASPAQSLTRAQVEALTEALHHVLQTAVRILVGNNSRGEGEENEEFPADWMFHRRWGKGKTKKSSAAEEPLPVSLQKITFVTVGGRTSAVSTNQIKSSSSTVSVKAASEKKRKRKADT